MILTEDDKPPSYYKAVAIAVEADDNGRTSPTTILLEEFPPAIPTLDSLVELMPESVKFHDGPRQDEGTCTFGIRDSSSETLLVKGHMYAPENQIILSNPNGKVFLKITKNLEVSGLKFFISHGHVLLASIEVVNQSNLSSIGAIKLSNLYEQQLYSVHVEKMQDYDIAISKTMNTRPLCKIHIPAAPTSFQSPFNGTSIYFPKGLPRTKVEECLFITVAIALISDIRQIGSNVVTRDARICWYFICLIVVGFIMVVIWAIYQATQTNQNHRSKIN